MATCIDVKISNQELSCGKHTTIIFDVIYDEGYSGEDIKTLYINYNSLGVEDIDYKITVPKNSTSKEIKLIDREPVSIEIKNINKLGLNFNLLLAVTTVEDITLCESISSISLLSCSEFFIQKSKICFNPFPVNIST